MQYSLGTQRHYITFGYEHFNWILQLTLQINHCTLEGDIYFYYQKQKHIALPPLPPPPALFPDFFLQMTDNLF